MEAVARETSVGLQRRHWELPRLADGARGARPDRLAAAGAAYDVCSGLAGDTGNAGWHAARIQDGEALVALQRQCTARVTHRIRRLVLILAGRTLVSGGLLDNVRDLACRTVVACAARGRMVLAHRAIPALRRPCGSEASGGAGGAQMLLRAHLVDLTAVHAFMEQRGV